MFRDTGGGHGEMMAQREAPAEMQIVELKSASEVQAATHEIGGHNLLSEHGFLEESRSEQGKWLETVQSEHIDGGGCALAIKQGGKTVGFALINSEGVIKRFHSVEGKESEVLKISLGKFKDKGFEKPTIHITEHSEHMRKILLDNGFRDKEKKDGKIVMEKE